MVLARILVSSHLRFVIMINEIVILSKYVVVCSDRLFVFCLVALYF